MAALKFASSHNMVAFLDKPTESDGFEQIVDFLNAHPIKYALTVNPTIYIKKQSRRKQRKDTEDPQLSGPTEPVTDDTENVAILALETTKTSQALEIDSLKRRVKKLEKNKGGSRTHTLRRLYNVGRSARVVSFEDEDVTLVNETQGRYGNNLMFDIGVLDNEQDMAKKEVNMRKDVSTKLADPVTTAGEVVTTANVVVSTAEVTTNSTTTTTVDELTLAQTLIEIKAAKPKAVTTAATTTTTAVTRPKARGVIVQEPSEFTTTTSPSQPSQLP
ncbi:hypothetical protein Tco_0879090 [Tanacetum coccineum]